MMEDEGRKMSVREGDEMLPTGPLSEGELLVARRLLRDYERSKWVRKQGKIWISWVIGAPVAIWGTWQAIHAMMDWIVKTLKG